MLQFEQNVKKLEIIRNNPFFCILGGYDLYELVISSQMKEYSQGSITNEYNQKLDKIGLVVSGKIKL